MSKTNKALSQNNKNNLHIISDCSTQEAEQTMQQAIEFIFSCFSRKKCSKTGKTIIEKYIKKDGEANVKHY